MRILTPRATPAARAPAPSTPPSSELPPLRAPVTIITPVSDHELLEGSLLVGRLPECDVTLDDSLVSRMHARISVREECVVVEDLHSTNGIYVNGARITHSALLHEGDRLLTGTTEISLFEARGSAKPSQAPLREAKDEPRRHASLATSEVKTQRPLPTTVPATPMHAFGKLELHLDKLSLKSNSEPPSETRLTAAASLETANFGALRSSTAAAPATARADALEVIGVLAERLAAEGNLEEARRVLSPHLQRILQGATAGLVVPNEVCAAASRHALWLARRTGDAAWINYVIELHVAAKLGMTVETFAVFEGAALSLGTFDRQLFSYYIGELCEWRARLSEEQRLVLERLVLLSGA